MIVRTLIVAALVLAAAPLATAEPDRSKQQAQALVTEGVSLLKARSYTTALARFQAAYAIYPSPKILLNIGTTLKDMGRFAEAANVYQEYLADPTTTPERAAEVKKLLEGLDARVMLLTVDVTPNGAEISIDGRSWQPIARTLVTRVMPGVRLVRARGPNLQPTEVSVNGDPGTVRRVALVLQPSRPVVAAAPVVMRAAVENATTEPGPVEIVSARAPARERSGGHLRVNAEARIDAEGRGAAGAFGIGYAPIWPIEAQVAALVSDSYGVYAGMRFRLMPTMLRPHLAVGVPIFFSDGTRVAGRVAAGGELDLGDHLAIVAEVGFEHFLNPEDRYAENVVVPSVGVQGRL